MSQPENTTSGVRYYAKRDDELTGPFPTYADAIGDHVGVARRIAGGLPAAQVLLDVGSVGMLNERATRRLLMTDPFLSAVFELGRRHERTTDAQHHDDGAAIDRMVLAGVIPAQDVTAIGQRLGLPAPEREGIVSAIRAYEYAGDDPPLGTDFTIHPTTKPLGL
ncbi:hypothetical protein [Mycolicibacter heraklionensis]|uniref:hypothetical protein n=1 Tax=Mycolicibacter heraklionensis TaxID=512402 RepID=UPI00069C2FBF|nr:hypothetical protein [Mycolicibacter heraklionensis]